MFISTKKQDGNQVSKILILDRYSNLELKGHRQIGPQSEVTNRAKDRPSKVKMV